MKPRIAIVMVSCLLLLTAGAAGAKAAEWGVGAGAALVPDYIGSDNYEVVPLPFFTVDFENHMNVHVVGNRLQSNLIPHPIWKAGVVGEYIGKRDDDVDNRRVSKLSEVDASIMLGPWVGLEYATDSWGTWSARLETMWDVTQDGNDGQLSRVAGGWGTGFFQTMRIGLEAFAGFGDGDFHDAYFDVSAQDSRRSGLKQYDSDAGLYEVGLSLNYAWNFANWKGRWNLHLIGGISQLVGDADDDSPVVDEGDETQGVGGLMISFHF